MRAYIAIVSAVSRAVGVFAALLIVSAAVVVSEMVFVRYVLGQSTVWQTEYVIYSVIAATFLGSPWVLIERGHVNVDILQLAAGPKLRAAMQMAAALASVAFVGILAYATWFYLRDAWTLGWTTETVWALPLWIPVAPVVVGCGLLVLQYLAEMIRLVLDGAPVTAGSAETLFSETTGGTGA